MNWERSSITCLSLIALGGALWWGLRSMDPLLARRNPIDEYDVLVAANRHKSHGGLVFIPTLVKALGGSGAKAAILKAADDGLLELRPESGMNRLSPQERAMCIPGPQGTVLSWARITG